MTNQELIGKEFELDNLICTIVEINSLYIIYKMRNKSGHIFENLQKVTIEFRPKIIKQLKAK